MTEFDCLTCGRYLLNGKPYFENPDISEEKYCLRCAIKKAELTPMDLVNLLID